MSRLTGREPRLLTRWWRGRSLRTRLTVIAATAIAASVFVAFQLASELLDRELRDSAEDQLRADSRVLAATAERDGLAQVELPPYPGSGRLVRVLLPDGTTRTPAGQPALPPVSERAWRVAQGASAGLMELDDSEEGYFIHTLPAGDGAVQVARAADDSPINRFGFGMLLIGLLCVVGGALVGRTVARTGLAPIDRLTAAAVRVAHTRDLDADIPDEGGGEIRRLIQSINDMLAALRDSRRAQRLLAEDAAHELKTPLTSLRLNVELLIRLDRRGTLDSALPAESRTRLLDDLGAQVAELSTLAAELTDLARGDISDESAELLDLADVVVAAATRARSRVPDIEVALDVSSVWVSGRPARCSAAGGAQPHRQRRQVVPRGPAGPGSAPCRGRHGGARGRRRRARHRRGRRATGVRPVLPCRQRPGVAGIRSGPVDRAASRRRPRRPDHCRPLRTRGRAASHRASGRGGARAVN